MRIDIAAVYEHLTGPLFKIPPSRLILYGQSIGSAPTLHLGARVRGLGAVIIHSAMRSGLSVFCSVRQKKDRQKIIHAMISVRIMMQTIGLMLLKMKRK